VVSALQRISDQIQIKDAYRDLLIHAKKNLPREESENYWHMRKLLHNAGDTVVHGRMLPADDYYYGRQVQKEKLLAKEPEFLAQTAI
jgi:hypothetical protein